MTKTILLQALYNLGDVPEHVRPLNHDAMRGMQELSSRSYSDNMNGIDVVEVISSDVIQWNVDPESRENRQTVFADVASRMYFDIFNRTRAMWEHGGVNILFADIDTLCLRECAVPTDDVFRMMSKCAVKARDLSGPQKQWLTVETAFSCGIRWFPATMDPKVWEVGAAEWARPHAPRWDWEQYVYNRMMYSQFPDLGWPPSKAPFPSLWDMHDVVLPEEGSVSGVKDPKIRHYPNSRGSVRALEAMRKDWEGRCASDSLDSESSAIP